MDLFLKTFLDLDAGRWLWSVLHYSCQLRIIVASFAELWRVEFGSWRFCTFLDGFCLFYIVGVDSGLTCGLIFGDLS